MNQLQSSYQTANNRGNLLGSNASLSPDSPFSSGSSGTQNITSQYRGVQSSFQPSGFVSSAYGQTAGGVGQLGQASQFGQAGQFANPVSDQYHTANYRGNQPGHDDYLRSDSNVPAQRQFGIGAQGLAGNVGIGTGISGISGTGASFQYGQTGQLGQTRQFGQTGQFAQAGQYGQAGQFANPVAQQYHTANYRGNQPGHDDYLRSDSNVPAQRQFGIGAQGISGNVGGALGGNIGRGIGGVAGGAIGGNLAGGVSGGNVSYAGQTTLPSAQSYHTANYRGNQPGHDNYLRSDSQQPAQQQFGIGTPSFSGNFGTGTGFTGR